MTELAQRAHAGAHQGRTGKLLGPYKGEVEKAINDGADPADRHPRAAGQERAARAGKRASRCSKSSSPTTTRWLKTRDAAARPQRPPPAAGSLCRQPAPVRRRHRAEEMIAKALTSFAEIRNQMQITRADRQGARLRGCRLPRGDPRAEGAADPDGPGDAAVRRAPGAIEAAVREQRIVTLPDAQGRRSAWPRRPRTRSSRRRT